MEKETIEIIGGLIVSILAVYGLINLGMLIFGITTNPLVKYLKSEKRKEKEKQDKIQHQFLNYSQPIQPLRKSSYASKVLHVSSLLMSSKDYSISQAICYAKDLVEAVDLEMDMMDREKADSLKPTISFDDLTQQMKIRALRGEPKK